MTKLSDRATKLLEAKNIGNVATIRTDGTPNVTPVWVDWDGENVIFNTAFGRAKEKHLRRDPRIAVEVFDSENPYNYVSINGTAQLREEGADDHINKLAKKYLRQDEYPFRQPGERRLIVKIRPEQVHENFPG